jgi:isochorismate hydrolase
LFNIILSFKKWNNRLGNIFWIKKNANDIIIQRKHEDAFQKTNLYNILLEKDIKEIIICGLGSNGCVFFLVKVELKMDLMLIF